MSKLQDIRQVNTIEKVMSRILKAGAALLAVAAIGFIYLRARVKQPAAPAQETAHSGPILIPGTQEPEEMRVKPMPVPVLSAPERMLADAQRKLGNNYNPATLLPELNRILAKYPDFADGYVYRLASLCEGKDRAAILFDVNRALEHVSDSRLLKESPGSLISMRAKIEYVNGDLPGAMEDLDKAIRANLVDARLFVNRGTTAERRETTCTWTERDLDALIQRFPTDYRTYLLRGIYQSSLQSPNQDALDRNRKLAVDELRKAAEMNTQSPLPYFFIAQLLSRSRAVYGRLAFRSGASAQRDDGNREVLNGLNTALTLDPNLLPALNLRAGQYVELKQFLKAATDYDVILANDPKNERAYNARGEAEMQLGEPSRAISDFSRAIEGSDRVPIDSVYYENRADAYIQTRQWDLAIQDLTAAISFWIGNQLVLMNVNQFRKLYPEYQAASDDAIARKLDPNLSSLCAICGFHGIVLAQERGAVCIHFHWRPIPETIGHLLESWRVAKRGS